MQLGSACGLLEGYWYNQHRGTHKQMKGDRPGTGSRKGSGGSTSPYSPVNRLGMSSGSCWSRLGVAGNVVKDLLGESFHAIGEFGTSSPIISV